MLQSDYNSSDSFFSHLAMACVALLLVGGGTGALAQTPAATVENGNGDVRLQVNYDGGLVVPGIFGSTTPADSIPATGGGARMMWYPAKAAFRAGRLLNQTDAWNAANVGKSSVAFGRDPIASGETAVALGEIPEATGENAVALGYNAQATGRRSVAIGEGTRAYGDFGTALGSNSQAYGVVSTALGFATEADAQAATAMGQSTHAFGRGSTVMGEELVGRSDHSVTIGTYNSANTTSGVNDLLFVAGNGSENARSDALVLDKDGNLEIAGTLTESSDRRLKTGIEPMGSVLDALKDIRPVHYRFKDGTGHPTDDQIGLVAQDVEAQFPELVQEGEDGYLSLAYPKFSAVLLKGLKEQQATIQRQKTQIDTLRSRVKRLERVQERQEQLARRMASLQESTPTDSAAFAGLSGSWLLGGGLVLLLLGGGIGTVLRRREW